MIEDDCETMSEKRKVLGDVSGNIASSKHCKTRRKSTRIAKRAEQKKNENAVAGLSDKESSDTGEDDTTGPLDQEVLNNSRESQGAAHGLSAGARRVSHAKQKSGIRAAAKRIARVKAGEVASVSAVISDDTAEDDQPAECNTQ